MGEENKRNMAEQGGTCLGEIQREGVGGNLFEGDAWHNDKEWRAIGESDSTAKRRGLSLSSELRVRCGPTAEMPDRKQEMASAAMQQLCQGEGGGRGRKEQSREVGATPQLHQHYCSLPEWGRAHLFYSESCSLLKFQTVMHWCQHKYSQLDQLRSS